MISCNMMCNIAVTGMGVLFRDLQANGLVWAVVHAGQTGLAVPSKMDRPPIFQAD